MTRVVQIAGAAVTTGVLVLTLGVPAMAAEVPTSLPQPEPIERQVETALRFIEATPMQRAVADALAAAQTDFEQRKATLLQVQDPFRELKREVGSAAKEMIPHA